MKTLSSKKGKGGSFVLFPSVGLLLKKNFILRKRQFVVTGLEIILPTLFAILLAVFKTWTPPTPDQPPNVIYEIPAVSEMDLIRELQQWSKVNKRWPGKKTFILGYAPANPFTDEIMAAFQESLGKFKNANKILKHETRAFPSEESIIEFNGKNVFGNANESITEILRAAIIFENGFDKSKTEFLNNADARDLAYKIRIVDKPKDKEFPTNLMYPFVRFPGPATQTAPAGYKLGGFTSIQVFLDKAIISVLTNQTVVHTIGVQPFPYPMYMVELDFSNIFIPFLSVLLVFGFIFVVPSILRNVVAEKESGVKELMKMMGLRSYLHWFSWMLDSMLMLLIPITVVIFLLFYPFSKHTGAFLTHSDPTLWWANLFLFGLSTVSVLFFISTFFSSTSMAIAVGIVFWIISYFSMFVPLINNYEWLSLSGKMFSCFAPHMAFHWAIRIMYSFEVKRIGATWYNYDQPLNSLDNFTVAHVMLMNIISTCVYFCLTLYFEAILPSQHGIRKPWYFIFKAAFWRDVLNLNFENIPIRENGASKPTGVDVTVDAPLLSPSHSFEEEPADASIKARVKIQNLKKRFGNKVAVDNLSLAMHDGQITVLLGCNGAGKTTLISMLTGMFSPTEGTATIDCHSIKTHMSEIRKQLGFCPQHNVLFEKLTVTENLEFFGQLKGMSSHDVKKEIGDLLVKLQLKQKQFACAGNLSGGQKRKLCLGMAIIGSSKVVILDEPTAGMDPEARRGIWDLLLGIKQNRTLLLTTHFMEEADILGDRVAIMSAGKIHCCGSPLFLKKYYGSGCTLKMTLKSPSMSKCDEILNLVKAHAPEAHWTDKVAPKMMNSNSNDPSNEACDISIVLPRTNGVNDTSKFPVLFAELNLLKGKLGIINIGLPLTTLDDVFTKVAEETQKVEKSDQNKVTIFERPLSENELVVGKENESTELTEFQKVLQQLQGLLLKRFHYTLRHKKLFAVQICLPLLIVMASLLIFNVQNAPLAPSPPLRMTLDPYKDPKTIFAATNETAPLGKIYESIIARAPKMVSAKVQKARANETLDEALLEIGTNDEDQYRERFVAAASFENENYVRALYQTIPYHASPLAVNLVSNTLLKYYMGIQMRNNSAHKMKDVTITVTSHPMKGGIQTLLDTATANPRGAKNLPLIFALLMPLGLSTLAASFVVFPLEERLCQAKSLQIMTGLSTFIFWMASFMWDMFLMILLATAMIVLFPILGHYSAFTTAYAAPSFYLIIIMFGLAIISLSYIVSLVMSTIAGGFALITITGILTGTLGVLLVHVLEQSNLFHAATVSRLILRPFPTFGASLSLVRFVDKVVRNVRCNMVPDSLKEIICDPAATFDPKLFVEDFQGCCETCAEFSNKGISCFETTSFLTWEGMSESDHVSREVILPGIGQELFYLFIGFVVFQIIIFLAEIFKPGDFLVNLVHKIRSKNRIQSEPTNAKNADVVEEKRRIRDLVSRGKTENDAIVVNGLAKQYGKLSAVTNMTFGVHPGECYGLLGVNGAGKTTLFKMMTGNLKPNSGNAFIGLHNLNSNVREYSRQIGYCPQYDGLIGCLTGRETLNLFCRLRGIPRDQIDRESFMWLSQLGLLEAGNVAVQNYSGGMKRRLSVAMSMIGHPKILMLDEPTSGVDPVSRRQFWNLVSAGKTEGQALILTSHSMDECEALCTRLGIMVDGRLECLGTIQHLKNRFSTGFTITVKINQNLKKEEMESYPVVICQEIREKLGRCSLKEQHKNIVEYHVVSDSTSDGAAGTEIDWSAIFEILENMKQENKGVLEDYSVNEITLEEIFMSVARSKAKQNTTEHV